MGAEPVRKELEGVGSVNESRTLDSPVEYCTGGGTPVVEGRFTRIEPPRVVSPTELFRAAVMREAAALREQAKAKDEQASALKKMMEFDRQAING